MAEPFIGEIMIFSGNFAPVGWMMCQGQTLPITSYQALFAIIGTFYGGNGTTNFQLPDLRGRVPVGFGQGAGLSSYNLGQVGGVENETLTIPQMPLHNHTFSATGASASVQAGSGNGKIGAPAGNYLVNPSTSGMHNFASQSDAGALGNLAGVSLTFGSSAIGTTGGNQPHPNVQPYLAVNYIIAFNGIFPTRG